MYASAGRGRGRRDRAVELMKAAKATYAAWWAAWAGSRVFYARSSPPAAVPAMSRTGGHQGGDRPVPASTTPSGGTSWTWSWTTSRRRAPSPVHDRWTPPPGKAFPEAHRRHRAGIAAACQAALHWWAGRPRTPRPSGVDDDVAGAATGVVRANAAARPAAGYRGRHHRHGLLRPALNGYSRRAGRLTWPAGQAYRQVSELGRTLGEELLKGCALRRRRPDLARPSPSTEDRDRPRRAGLPRDRRRPGPRTSPARSPPTCRPPLTVPRGPLAAGLPRWRSWATRRSWTWSAL
ncbi:hypothetical protein QJS66_18295 [Kocuria rhizophila]|nr:hypothetical protein QJS66_18295 [Kocuria rhizophila]